MKKVLLTGATGFIGRHCIEPLSSRGYEVHAVSSRDARDNSADAFWHRADLMDSERVSSLMGEVRPTHLLHFAWFVEPGKYLTSLENFYWARASMDLLQAFAQHGGERVVMAGSCIEYDWNYGYCSEWLTPLSLSTPYASCKQSLHVMLDSFAGQTDLSAAWGRVFFLYGPHEHPARLVSSVVRAVLRGEVAPCSHGEQVRDFLHVRDVADAFAALLDSDVSGAVNIASGRPVAIKDIVHEIGEKVGGRDLIRLGTLPDSESEPPLLVADIGRLRDEVGWTPEYDLDRGLEQTVNWWKARKDYG
ncbi:NAD-dependent epimerase/dehydratase family protein [soil metagenome]